MAVYNIVTARELVGESLPIKINSKGIAVSIADDKYYIQDERLIFMTKQSIEADNPSISVDSGYMPFITTVLKITGAHFEESGVTPQGFVKKAYASPGVYFEAEQTHARILNDCTGNLRDTVKVLGDPPKVDLVITGEVSLLGVVVKDFVLRFQQPYVNCPLPYREWRCGFYHGFYEGWEAAFASIKNQHEDLIFIRRGGIETSNLTAIHDFTKGEYRVSHHDNNANLSCVMMRVDAHRPDFEEFLQNLYADKFRLERTG